MPSGGYGGIHFHNAPRNGAYGSGTIRWGMFYNYSPEIGTTGGGLSFVESNLITRLYLSTNGNVGIGLTSPTNLLHVNGDVAVIGNVNFGRQTRQMLNLWGTQYGIGIQSYTTYFRTDNSGANNGFSWFSGGVHSDNQNDPGTGGAELMRLTVGTGLTVNGALNLPTAPAIYAGGARFLRSDGSQNVGLGYTALNNNSSGTLDTAVGYTALFHNTTGSDNAAFGDEALYFNTTGVDNTAAGTLALYNNTSGNYNTGAGNGAIFSNTNGSYNTAQGYLALAANKSGSYNTAIGSFALESGTTGSQNIAIGYLAGNNLTGGGNIDIGSQGVATDQGVIRIGDTNNQIQTYIAGIYGWVVSGAQVFVAPDGRLGAFASSARFKQNIQSMGDASDVLLSLQPVTFQYKPEIDPQGAAQFGLVAEDVAKVDPDLILRDGKGRPFSVRYEAVNAMLLNEFLKQHKTVEAQKSEVEKLKAGNADLKEKNESLEKRIAALEEMVFRQREKGQSLDETD
jgi:hypothetical protein